MVCKIRYDPTGNLLSAEVQEVGQPLQSLIMVQYASIICIYDSMLPLRAEHPSSLVGERLEIPPLCRWDSLLGKPWLNSPGVNVPMKIEQGLICSSLPGDMAVGVGRSTAKVPSGLDPLPQSSACAKLCHKELLIS